MIALQIYIYIYPHHQLHENNGTAEDIVSDLQGIHQQ